MEKSDVYQDLVRYINEYLETEIVLDPDARLANAIPGIDSLRLQELLIYLEDRFGVPFDEDIMDKTETVRGLADYVHARLAKA